jgi:hypothetical protein
VYYNTRSCICLHHEYYRVRHYVVLLSLFVW